jgi:uncharacterized protein YdaU (DUF1376 family)
MKTPDSQTPANISKWMPLWIGDMRRETIGQPPEFVGMYINLMMAAWQNGGQLPADEKQLRRISGADAIQWREYRQELSNLFVPIGNVWTHNLIREELAKSYKIREDRSAAGRAGGVNRWTKARSKAKEATDTLMAQITQDGAAY